MKSNTAVDPIELTVAHIDLDAIYLVQLPYNERGSRRFDILEKK